MTYKVTLSDFTGEDSSTIIEEVKIRQLLWDPANKNHKNAMNVLKNWEAIADLLSDGKRIITGLFFLTCLEN